MDVDPTPGSSMKRTSVSPPTSPDKRPKRNPISIPMELNATLNNISVDQEWQYFMTRAGDDISKWKKLLANVVRDITEILAESDQKSSYIPAQTWNQGAEIVEGFSKEQLTEWKEGVRKGVEQGNWNDLVNHSVLKKTISPSNSERSELSLSSYEKGQIAVINAWKSEYRGEACQVLLKAIDHLHKIPAGQNYAKLLPITQSSGTGKSKTIDEVAKNRILFPLCLREDLGGDFAYPPPDVAVRDYLLQAPDPSDGNPCKQFLRDFLITLLDVAKVQAETFFGATDAMVTMEKRNYVDIANLFYAFFSDDSNRNQFYEDVVSRARNDSNPSSKQFVLVFKNLEKILKENCRDWPKKACPILISIDEVHVLHGGQHNSDDRAHSLYSRLKSVLNEVAGLDFCVTVLSTVTSIPKLAPPKHLVPSLRERLREDFKLPAPYTELPFDAYIIADPLVPGRYGLDSVVLLRFCAKFGRPLFYSLYLSHRKMGYEDDDDIICNRMMPLIVEKLYGQTLTPDSLATLNPSTIAILSARLLLDLSPATTQARQYEMELVRSHLRMLYSVHLDQQVMVTGSSPEPLVAEAAATIMNYQGDGQRNYMDIWTLLLDFIKKGLLGQGTVGELIGRALSITAMDRAIDDLDSDFTLKYQTPVPVIAYYRALLTDEAWEIVRKSKPANPRELSVKDSEITFEDAFAGAYVHFSHYGKANDATPLQDRYAWALWLRGTAILCQLHQELTDRAIPIYFSKLGNVGPMTMSMILDQDKAGQSADPSVTKIQSASSLGLFSSGKKLPYIAAVHCYTLTSDQGIVAHVPHNHDLRHVNLQDQRAPCYQIDIRGLLPYRGISTSVRTAIQAMLDNSRDFLYLHHPRKYGLGILRKMQPLLNGETETTEWFGGLGE